MAAKPEFQRRLEGIEDLIRAVEATADADLQAVSRELVELVMALHRAALERVLELLRAGGEPGMQWIDRLGRDDLVSGLLILHGLHPETMEVRLKKAIDKILPSLRKRGGEVEILSIDEAAVRLGLRANGHTPALKDLLEGAVYQAAPDITTLIIEGGEERSGFVPLEMLRAAATPQAVAGKDNR